MRCKVRLWLQLWLLLILPTTSVAGMVAIPAGEYRPLYLSNDSPIIKVNAFRLDQLPVTNQQFLQFVSQQPRWQKTTVASVFAEKPYLQHWHYSKKHQSWLPNADENSSAVVNISWFSAQAYCQAQGQRLPTVAEWEYVARASETRADGSQESGYQQRILNWYARPNSKIALAVGQTPANYWGVKDLHGLHWEWTDDFNSSLVSGESRADSSIDQKLFCAAGSAGAVDPSDYAAFMRYGFRASLQAKFTLANLGFRCAADRENSYEAD